MADRPLVLLGASGRTGRALARRLLARTDVRMVLAGRDGGRLETLARELEAGGTRGRVTCARADAADRASLVRAFAGAALVVVTASISRHTREVASACLEAGADWYDLVVSEQKLHELLELAPAIASAGRCFVTEGGFHPGLPGAMVRALAPEFDALERAVVQSVIQIDWRALAPGRSTVNEFLDEIVHARMDFFRDGRWRTARWWSTADYATRDFGPPFGRRIGAPLHLEEMRGLPARFTTLRETGFYVGGFNPFVDWVVFPLAMVALRVAPGLSRRPLGALFLAALRAFSRPPFGTVLRLDASGLHRGAPRAASLTVGHEDGYELTAMVAEAAVEQMLDGTVTGPGVWLQALAVEPTRLLRDLESMGARVERTG